jgi:predicted HNH restriction endonuclease
MCGSKDNIQAHHINSWADFPEDRFILENGLTMCKPCHDTYHKYEKEVRRNQN